MALESTSRAFDSREIPSGNLSEERNKPYGDQLEDETRKIYDLVRIKVEGAAIRVIIDLGGTDVVMRGLNCSGYSNATELCRNMTRAVATFHAKLTARENKASGDVLIAAEEYEQTIRRLLQEAFMNHGASLRNDLENLRTRRVSGGEKVGPKSGK